MRPIGNLLAVGAACSLTVACADFQASPTASSCAQSANAFTAAETAEVIAQATLNVAQGNGAPLADVQKAQTDLSAAQALVSSLQAQVASKCATAAK